MPLERYIIQATGRAYITYREKPAAFVVVQEGRILRLYKNLKFPFSTAQRGTPVPTSSMLRRRKLDVGVASEVDAAESSALFDVPWGQKPPALFEQVLPQQLGYALILLHPEVEADEDEGEDREGELTSRERYRRRLADGR